MKTSELTGAALDWAVAKCEGLTDESPREISYFMRVQKRNDFRYSTDWAQGGPIIEREGMRLHRSHTSAWWAGSEAEPQRPIEGPTPLVAAMRCYVASKLGDEIEIPEELQ